LHIKVHAVCYRRFPARVFASSTLPLWLPFGELLASLYDREGQTEAGHNHRQCCHDQSDPGDEALAAGKRVVHGADYPLDSGMGKTERPFGSVYAAW
jgi:hypothetical protein